MENVKTHIHMVGIGGIGMSALAQLYRERGYVISGSDRSASPTTELLEGKGVNISFGHRAENIPRGTSLLVYSDAVPADNPERVLAHENNIPQMNYFEALGEISKNMRTIAVAGTHGKTTTTAMLVKILRELGVNPTGIIGSIVKDFGSNYVPGDENLLVVEACEYRDHLLELSPEILVIGNLEWDHSDYFPSLEALQDTFAKAIACVPLHGHIVTDTSNLNIAPLLKFATCNIVDYTKEICPPLPLIGDFNIANAKAAIAAAKLLASKAGNSRIAEALADFKGTWRRFEFKGQTKNGARVFDDYAHHPTAVRVTIKGVREKFPDKKIAVAFHPHLYSRTRDFMDEFAGSLALADEVILAPIYPAREEPIEGVTSDELAKRIGSEAEVINSFENIANVLELHGDDTIILTMGAGDIYKVAELLTK